MRSLTPTDPSCFIQPTATFAYSPPPAAKTAQRILLKPNLGYPTAPPVTVTMAVIKEVIAGIRRVNPDCEILIVEGVCHALPASVIVQKLGLVALLDEKTHFLDADTLLCCAYPNTSCAPRRFAQLWAPQLLKEVDCRISIGALKRTKLKGEVLMSCGIKNLYGLLPRERYHARSPHARGQLHRPDVHAIISDVYHTLGVLFDGAVVDGTQKFISRDWQPDLGTAQPCGQVLWGNDLLAVDRVACELAGEGFPKYLTMIEQDFKK
jgi:uncharacterized protein (DUF362 family)